MYKRVVIVPYKMGSSAAKALKEELVAAGIRCFRKLYTSTFQPKKTDLVIYYGGDQCITTRTPHNTRNSVRYIAQNKLYTLRVLADQGLSTVPWTTDPNIVLNDWLHGKHGPQAVARNTLTGHSGQGITILSGGETFVEYAPLYTKYIKKTFECRIHVYNGSVIDAQIKKKVAGAEANPTVRNHHTGWVYCREGYEPTEACKDLAIKAVAALELDFGAVDLIYNKHYDMYYILEVNTAPGLTGTTLLNYAKAIQNEIN
jgi:glutathione synthase/RimK-type ligase-like ATP-grasp enzyme